MCDSVHRGGLQAGRTPLGREESPRQGGTPPDQADTPQTRQKPPHPGPGRHPPGPGRNLLDQADPPGPGRHPPRPSRPTPQTRQTPPPPPQARTRQPPPPGSRLQNTVYERPVRILLECILVKWCDEMSVIIVMNLIQHNNINDLFLSTYPSHDLWRTFLPIQ